MEIPRTVVDFINTRCEPFGHAKLSFDGQVDPQSLRERAVNLRYFASTLDQAAEIWDREIQREGAGNDLG